jgi:hypothetical protein
VRKIIKKENKVGKTRIFLKKKRNMERKRKNN